MKKLFTILLLVSALKATGQPTLNSSVFPVPGTTFYYQDANPGGLLPGPAGANQTWNFSTVTPTGSPVLQNFVTPASTPYSSSHPGATVCETISDGAGGFIYAYYISNTSATELKGISFLSGTTPVNFIYSNTQKVLQYPLTYTNSFTDAFVGSYTIIQTGITITDYRSGTETVTGDGYGTLIVPGATYTNVLRVKIRQLITDSIVYVGVPIPAVVQHYFSTTHNWISATISNKLAQMTLSFDTTISSNPTTYNSYARYQPLSTGIAEQVNLHNEILSSPNPAFESTMMRIDDGEPGEAHLRIVDANGRLIKAVTLNFNSADNNNIMVDLTDYAKGIYSMQVMQKDKSWVAKVVKL
jgi:hypothetical protein